MAPAHRTGEALDAAIWSLAILMGLVGHLCAAFITIFGGFAVLRRCWASRRPYAADSAVRLRAGCLRWCGGCCATPSRPATTSSPSSCWPSSATRCSAALRRLCPAKLEGRDQGDLISVITSDIELLEVFYAHTISPAAIAAAVHRRPVRCSSARYHVLLGPSGAGGLRLTVGVLIPLATSRRSGDTGLRFRQPLRCAVRLRAGQPAGPERRPSSTAGARSAWRRWTDAPTRFRRRRSRTQAADRPEHGRHQHCHSAL